MTAAEQEAAQEQAVQREAYYQQTWDLIVHPAHRAGERRLRSGPYTFGKGRNGGLYLPRSFCCCASDHHLPLCVPLRRVCPPPLHFPLCLAQGS